jgi:hypothetical protein
MKTVFEEILELYLIAYSAHNLAVSTRFKVWYPCKPVWFTIILHLRFPCGMKGPIQWFSEYELQKEHPLPQSF